MGTALYTEKEKGEISFSGMQGCFIMITKRILT